MYVFMYSTCTVYMYMYMYMYSVHLKIFLSLFTMYIADMLCLVAPYRETQLDVYM